MGEYDAVVIQACELLHLLCKQNRISMDGFLTVTPYVESCQSKTVGRSGKEHFDVLGNTHWDSESISCPAVFAAVAGKEGYHGPSTWDEGP